MRCRRCKKSIVFDPPLRQRTQTPAEAKALGEFLLEGTGGMCSSCYVKWRDEDAKALMRRIVGGAA